jgi:hypothetical protein
VTGAVGGGTSSAAVLIDVRQHDAFFADGRLITSAIHCAP